MEEVRSRLPFCLDFIGCKLLNLLYLFASRDSVILKETVMLTDKIEHSLECGSLAPLWPKRPQVGALQGGART